MKEFDFVTWKENKYYVSLCLGNDVSSFGKSAKKAVSLYYDNEVENVHLQRELIIPYVSDEEQADIERLYGAPSDTEREVTEVVSINI